MSLHVSILKSLNGMYELAIAAVHVGSNIKPNWNTYGASSKGGGGNIYWE